MKVARRCLLGSASGWFLSGICAAADTPRFRIGVLNDQSGPNRDGTGMGSVVCARQAVTEAVNGAFSVDVIAADHQNRPDLAVSIVRQWLDREDVDMILDVPISSIALAVAAIIREKNKVMVCSGSGSTDLTGAQCNPNTVQWTYDTYMLARSTATQVVRLGGRKWFFMTGDYVFGRQLERDASIFVRGNGGTVVGRAVYPFPGTTDFSSYLLQAKASEADVICFTVGGDDTINGIKQAHEFGLTAVMKMVAMAANPADVEEIGRELGQGLFLSTVFYWDLTEGSRSFTHRVLDSMPRRQPPNSVQAGCYSGTLHYLKAVAAIGPTVAKADGAAVVRQMKALPVNDEAFGSGSIRLDGRATFPVHLLEAKSPRDIQGRFDTLRLVATSPAEQAWRPMSEGGCPMVNAEPSKPL